MDCPRYRKGFPADLSDSQRQRLRFQQALHGFESRCVDETFETALGINAELSVIDKLGKVVPEIRPSQCTRDLATSRIVERQDSFVST